MRLNPNPLMTIRLSPVSLIGRLFQMRSPSRLSTPRLRAYLHLQSQNQALPRLLQRQVLLLPLQLPRITKAPKHPTTYRMMLYPFLTNQLMSRLHRKKHLLHLQNLISKKQMHFSEKSQVLAHLEVTKVGE